MFYNLPNKICMAHGVVNETARLINVKPPLINDILFKGRREARSFCPKELVIFLLLKQEKLKMYWVSCSALQKDGHS